MDKKSTPSQMDKGYARMLERTHEIMSKSGERLEAAVEQARDTAHELGELTRDEAELLAQYVKRDLRDMGDHLRDENDDLRAWFHMDTELIESSIRDLLFSVADQTSLQLAEFARAANQPATWHTGEITAPGVLECTQCGHLMHFTQVGRIPPCAQCHHTEFRRRRDLGQARSK
ncbi:zinc ribbon-containing protein [Acidihalobacter ferrooxydans]|uniref:Zinc ribbon-containing protein n=1 Tax=Acidihalobacter ferrooxydans TaxID=1765967 RepID=A0A1P8UI57_9GAMM|nr:zinc ribbon-containing protein [Acidihalobacter ferrooxydans]APZ43520.1 hypothetical protein BW247_10830 [Acidihalobacter ferrooxydans]